MALIDLFHKKEQKVKKPSVAIDHSENRGKNSFRIDGYENYQKQKTVVVNY